MKIVLTPEENARIRQFESGFDERGNPDYIGSGAGFTWLAHESLKHIAKQKRKMLRKQRRREFWNKIFFWRRP